MVVGGIVGGGLLRWIRCRCCVCYVCCWIVGWVLLVFGWIWLVLVVVFCCVCVICLMLRFVCCRCSWVMCWLGVGCIGRCVVGGLFLVFGWFLVF